MGQETGRVGRLDVADMDDGEVEERLDAHTEARVVPVTAGVGVPPLTNADLQTSTAATESTNDDEINATRAQIEQTRTEMGQTIDAIKDRLNPQHLMEQAKETVRDATIGRAQQAASSAVDAAKEAVSSASDTARGASQMIIDTIKENPIPAAMAGIGLCWLWTNARRSNDGVSRYREHRYAYDSPVQYEELRYDRSELDPTRTQGPNRVAEMTDQVREKVGDVADQVQEKAGRMADQAQHKAQRAAAGFERMVYENPLAVGAAAMALGAVVGLSVPETQQENRLMGQTRDALVEKAQQTAQDVAQKAKSVAQEAMDTARDEARSQGLTP